MKLLKRILLVLLGIGIVYLTALFYLIHTGKNTQPASNADTLLILGAQVKGDPAYPSVSLRERLDESLVYLEENPKTEAVVCGGQGLDESDTEANVMAEYLKNHGISENRIVKEGTSTRTKENIQNAMDKKDLGTVVICTSDFHQYRALLLAKRLGLENVTGLPAKSDNSATFKMNLREIAALGYGLIFDW